MNRFELDEEMYIACAIVNESLYDKNADKKKVVSEEYLLCDCIVPYF